MTTTFALEGAGEIHEETRALLTRASQAFPGAAEEANRLPGQSVVIVDGRSPQGREIGLSPGLLRLCIVGTADALDLSGDHGALVRTLATLLPELRVVVVLSETRVAVLAHPCGPLPLDMLTRAA